MMKQRARKREDVVQNLSDPSPDSRGGQRFGEKILCRSGEREAVVGRKHESLQLGQVRIPEYGHEMGEWSADSGTDTFVQLLRLPQESAPNKGRIVLVVEREGRALYICKGRRKRSDHEKPPISSCWCYKPTDIIFEGCQNPSSKVVLMRLWLRAISCASTTVQTGTR